MDQVFDAWLSTGSFAIGIDTTLIGQPLLDELGKADLYLKAMANFESLSDRTYPPGRLSDADQVPACGRPLGAGTDQNVVKLCVSNEHKSTVNKGRF